MLEENVNIIQNVIIENRKKINISGVKEVISFDEETILLDSALGKITVKGEDLHVESFITDTGELSVNGKIYAAVYMSDVKSSGGFISRLFR